MKFRYLVIVAAFFMLIGGYIFSSDTVLGQNSSVNVLNPWKVVSGYILPRDASNGLQIDSLASSNDCLVTDATGKVSTATCGVGGGTTEPVYWLNNGTYVWSSTTASAPTFVATSSAATSSLPYLSVTGFKIGSDYITDLTGTGLTVSGNALAVSLANDYITPNMVLSTGQTDEYCLTYEATGSTWEWQPCGSGGSSSGWSTTTSSVAGQLNLYSLNETDIVNIGSNSTTTSEFWFDPNTVRMAVNGSNGTSSVVLGSSNNEWVLGTSDTDKSLRIASSTGLLDGATASFSIAKSGLLTFGNASSTQLSWTATSSGSNGINITSGCYAISGTCITGTGSTFSTTSADYWAQNDLTLTEIDTGVGASSTYLRSNGSAPVWGGIYWGDLANMPADFADGVDNTGGAPAWGSITGTLSNQTDLQNALNLKIDNSTTTLPLIAHLAGLVDYGSSSATTTALGHLKVTSDFAVGGNSYLSTIKTGTWNGTSIGDAYIDDTITASNYVLTSAFNGLFDTRLGATTSLPQLGTLAGLVTFGSSSATTTAAGHLKVTGALTVNGDYITDITGTGLSVSGGVLNVTATGSTEPVYWLHNGTYAWSSSTVSVPAIVATSTTVSSTFASKVGVGTTTPAWMLTSASSTAPQLALTDPGATADKKHWTVRSSNGSLFFATSTDAYATSATAAMSIVPSSGTYLGVATSSPWRTLSVSGTVAFNGLTTAAGTPNTVCINATTKEVTENAALTCTVSSILFKHDVKPLVLDSISIIGRMNPVEFVYNDQPSRIRYGFIAEELDNIDYRLADGFDEDGRPRSIDQNAILAVIVRAVQEQQAEIDAFVDRSAEHWQWVALILLAFWNGYQQILLRRYADRS